MTKVNAVEGRIITEKKQHCPPVFKSIVFGSYVLCMPYYALRQGAQNEQ